MKVLVIFGSKSDANIYEPLKARLLNEGHEVDFRMLSVHRSPELLDKTLAGVNAEAVVAGAGLAAHLPGIVASKLLIPVFGISCAAAVGGVDAFFAIAQMPFGIPVLASASDQYLHCVDAIGRIARLELQYSFEKFNLVFERHKKSQPHFQVLLERAQKIAEKTGVALNLTDKPVENSVNLFLVDISETDPEAPLEFAMPGKKSDDLGIFVPVLNEKMYRDPFAALAVARRVNSVPGALWVGINNVGNAMLAALQLANGSGTHSAFLTNAKKGYVHA
ncbi:MAG TPA: AIR carboxylase family protein [Bdellovibrionota bacterium]|jgi:5-(carboxyamino)imidazole ribonucleotide mutase